MNKSIKRIISFVLCLCMLSSMPIISFAAVDKVATLKVASFSDSKVELQWSKVDGADGYEVYRLKSGDDDWKRLKRVDSLSYSDSVSPGTYYSYRVRAYKDKFLSKEYGAYSETVNVASKPKNVTGLKAKAYSSKGIELTWSAADGAQNYVVYMYNAKTKEYERVGTTDKLSYKVTGLSASTKYYFQVRAYHKLNGTITSDWTKISATTPLGDVENFRLKECTETTYALSWSKTKDAEGYEIYKYDTKTDEWDFFRSTKARSYKFKGVGKNYNVLYKIRSFTTASGKKTYGVFSEPIAAGTIPAAPTKIVAARN
ncbi:MAG: fibronectin type III domain-containing protein, partial [Clostridia bacterium]|nr:fibronectin type III domain-containing protein [Clostridia bacterium]